MLYNPKWEPPKRDIFSWDSLITWLETKNPDEAYCYISGGTCMLAQYFTAVAGKAQYIGVGQVDLRIGDKVSFLPLGWNRVAETMGHTFGEALERARAANTPRRATLRMLTFGLLG